MNSKFLITLKRVSYSRNAFPDAVEQLGEYSNKLQKTLQKYALKNSEILKQFAISDLRQITEEKKRLFEWHTTLSNKSRADLNDLPYSETVEYSKDMEYYGEILTLADSAISELRKYLKVYFPDILIPRELKKTKLSDILIAENKFIKGMEMNIVVKHFECLTIKKNKANRNYLTNEQFISFLKRGFLDDKTQPKQTIDYMPGEKGLIVKLFYDFYALAFKDYYCSKDKEPFINLIIDCFEGWELKKLKSYFKPNKVIGAWK
jgi:hypothetical protein